MGSKDFTSRIRLSVFLAVLVLLLFLAPNAYAASQVAVIERQATSTPLLSKQDVQELSATIENAMQSFHSPGMAIGIVHQNEVVLSKGYGYARLSPNMPVTAQTHFRIASLSKAFTAAALAILVDQGKIDWHDKVTEHLPQFSMYDPYVTREFTIIDLLSHKSGLVGGAGDSMLWPEPSSFTPAEVVHNLRYLSPEYGFRSQYAYSNVLYITAGQVIAALSGESFDRFLETNLFAPLNMHCFAGNVAVKTLSSTAFPYGHNDSKGIFAIERNKITQASIVSAAAGGIVCDLESMNKWTQALLSPSTLPFSAQQYTKLLTPQTILSIPEHEQEWDNKFFNSYALGWRISNVGNVKTVSHTGTISGFQSYVLMVPELSLGISILSNGSNSGARGAVMQAILKHYLRATGHNNEPQNDWVEAYQEYWHEREQEYLANFAKPVASAPMSITNEQIIGRYKDQWFGDLLISRNNNGLRIESAKMVTLKGDLLPFQDATYKIEWDNKNAANDAFIHFTLNIERQVVSANLHPFSNKQTTNHEYRDMLFVRLENQP